MKNFINVIAFLSCVVVAHRIGVVWDGWTHSRHPSLNLFPLPALLASTLISGWVHVSNGLNANQNRFTASEGIRLGLWTVVAAFFTGIFLPGLVGAAPHTKGKLVGWMFFVVATGILSAFVIAPQQRMNTADCFRRLMKFRLFRIGLGLIALGFASLLVLGFVELAFWGLRGSPTLGPRKIYEGEYMGHGFSDWDANLGRALSPNRDVACRLKVDGETIWDVRYSTDEFGRRTTLNPNESALKYAVFFGCSFLFGEGANDDQTIPSLFAAAAPQYRAYNYGVPGYGTQHMLAKLEEGTLRDEISEDTGIVIYLYLEEVHEPRVIGGMQIYNSFGADFPYYDFDPRGELQRYGSFKTGRPYTSTMYSLLDTSNIVKYLGMNFPKRTDRHFELEAEIIARSNKLARQQLNCERFLVVSYPIEGAHNRLIPHLRDNHIDFLNSFPTFNPAEQKL